MKAGIDHANTALYTEVDPVSYVVADAADGWIDTDVSASHDDGLVFVWCFRAIAGQAGARKPGSAIDMTVDLAAGINQLVGIARVVNGHIELWRDAGSNNNYLLCGYIQ